MYMKEATKRIRLGPDNLPSVCFYTFLNAYQVKFYDAFNLSARGAAVLQNDG